MGLEGFSGGLSVRRFALVLALGIVMVTASLLPAARQASAAVEVEVGDYWEYVGDADLEGMSAEVKLKMKVTGTEGSGASEVYVIALSGSGSVSGSFGTIQVTGDIDLSGEMKRLKSNLSLLSSEFATDISMEMVGQTGTVTMEMTQTNNPVLDDYIGDDNPGHGGTIVSKSNVTMVTVMKTEVSGMVIVDETDTSWYNAVQTIQVAAANETVTVPAGTFECYKYTITLEMNGTPEVLTYYYSDEVGNFVKMDGLSQMMGGLGNPELKAYSFGGHGSGGASLFSGTNLLVIIVIIVAILVVVSLVLMMRRRGKAVAPMPVQMPPPDMGAPPPPPPGS